jgi:leader peptidase (prepilin peptidase) / N-methyltransferase
LNAVECERGTPNVKRNLMTEYYFILTCAVLLGAGVGSFLAMAAYRMPRGLSFVEPSRSFCPGCNLMIPWYRNLPILSWLLQRGRCFCPKRQKLSVHYLLLEVICAVMFGLNAVLAPQLTQIAFFSLLAAYVLLTSAIDLEHRTIPTTLCIQVAVIGLIFACTGLNPALSGETIWTRLSFSVGGLVSGGGAVALLMLIGKTFHRSGVHDFEPPVEIRLEGRTIRSRQRKEEEWDESPLSDYLLAPWERLEFHVSGATEIVTLKTATPEYRFSSTDVRRIVVPRDAIGYGDLKWLAALGAWVGPLGALETLGLASILACAGIVFVLINTLKKPVGLPFAPWLGAAAYLLLLHASSGHWGGF